MRRILGFFVIILFFVFIGICSAEQNIGEEKLNDFLNDNEQVFSGTVKNFTQVERYYSHPSFSERYEGSNEFSLRLMMDWRAKDWLALQFHGTERAVFWTGTSRGSSAISVSNISQAGFRRAKMSRLQIDRNNFSLESDVDYLNLSLNLQRTDLILGRQAVTYGRTFFWNPTDWLITFGAATLDREYKPGIDAVRLKFRFGQLSNGELVYALKEKNGGDDYALIGKMYTNQLDWDIDVLAGKVGEDSKAGFGISGEIKGAGLRGEGSVTLPENKSESNFFQGAIEADYKWKNSLQLMGEFYYNGSGTSDRENYNSMLSNLLTTDLVNLARYYFGMSIQYEFTPIFRTSTNYIANLVDNSGIFYPSFIYSVSGESDFILGASIAFGKRPKGSLIRSEFGMLPSIFFLQYKLNF